MSGERMKNVRSFAAILFLTATLAQLALGYPRTVLVENFTNWG